MKNLTDVFGQPLKADRHILTIPEDRIEHIKNYNPTKEQHKPQYITCHCFLKDIISRLYSLIKK